MADRGPIRLSPPRRIRGRRHKALRGRFWRRAIWGSQRKGTGKNLEILQLVLFLHGRVDAGGGDGCSLCAGQRWLGMGIRNSDCGNGDLVYIVRGWISDVQDGEAGWKPVHEVGAGSGGGGEEEEVEGGDAAGIAL